jgi:hypothetical protein
MSVGATERRITTTMLLADLQRRAEIAAAKLEIAKADLAARPTAPAEASVSRLLRPPVLSSDNGIYVNGGHKNSRDGGRSDAQKRGRSFSDRQGLQRNRLNPVDNTDQ